MAAASAGSVLFCIKRTKTRLPKIWVERTLHQLTALTPCFVMNVWTWANVDLFAFIAKHRWSCCCKMSQREEKLWKDFLQGIRDDNEDQVKRILLETGNPNLGGGKSNFLTRKITTTQVRIFLRFKGLKNVTWKVHFAQKMETKTIYCNLAD